MENKMKKLLTFAILLSFCTANAGIWGSIKNKVKSVKETVTNKVKSNGGAISAIVDQKIAEQTAGNISTITTVISNPALQSELSNSLSSLYDLVSRIRQTNLTNPTIVYYATQSGIYLQACINNISITPSNFSTIKGHVGSLIATLSNNAGNEEIVQNLTQRLTMLETVVVKISSSVTGTISGVASTISNANTITKSLTSAVSNASSDNTTVQSLASALTRVVSSANTNAAIQSLASTVSNAVSSGNASMSGQTPVVVPQNSSDSNAVSSGNASMSGQTPVVAPQNSSDNTVSVTVVKARR